MTLILSGVHTLLQHLFQNQWIGLVAIDPATREFHRYRPDTTWEAMSPSASQETHTASDA